MQQMRIFVVKFIMFVNIYLLFVKISVNMKRLLVVIVSLIGLVASAKTYYVAPTGGSDYSPGTLTQPWATWQKALKTAQAGDTVYFRGGVWYHKPGDNIEMIPSLGIGHSGTADNYIHFLNYPNETPILDGSLIRPTQPSAGSETWSGGLYIEKANYIHWRGLTIRNYWQIYDNVKVQGMVIADSKYHRFENITVHDISGRGIFYSPSVEVDSTYFINCDVYNCCDSMYTGGFQGGWGDGWNAGNMTTDSYLLFDGCRAWNNSDDGFNLWGAGLVEVKNSWSFGNGRLGGDGNGFKITDAAVVNNDFLGLTRRLTNNLAAYNFGNTGGGFTEANNGFYSIEGQWYNNTSYNNYIGYITGGWLTPPQRNNDYRNNIAYASTWWTGKEVDDSDWSGGGFFTSICNTWTTGITFTVSNEDFALTDKTTAFAQLTADRKSGGSLPDITFLKLREGSDLIDAGVDVGLPFTGSAPDIGYSEFNAGSVTVSSPVFVSAAIENAAPSKLEMTFSITLANIVPAVSAFTVKVNSISRSISSVTISGTKVILTLSSQVVYGDAVTIAYTKPSVNPLQTPSGGQAVSFSAKTVINNCGQGSNLPPLVFISSPTKNTSFTAPATITINASASDPDGTISKVEFFNGSSKLGECVSLPYTFTWKNIPEGTYIITAVANDNLGSRSTSEPVVVVVEKSISTVNQLPLVSIKNPNKGRKFSKNEKIVIEAVASDPDGEIVKVEFKNGTTTISEIFTAPYIYVMGNADAGKYIITAVATDNLGATSEVSETEFTILDSYYHNFDPLKLYPNPNDGHFTLDLSDFEAENYPDKVSIINMSGKIIKDDLFKDLQYIREFNLGNLSPGTYVLMLTKTNCVVSTGKLIIK